MPDPKRLRAARAAPKASGTDFDQLIKEKEAIVELSPSEKVELAEVEQLGSISLEELHKYHCDNPNRRVVSLLGTLYDVTSAVEKYGPDGSYKEFAGHDITLNLGAAKMEELWLDCFIKMKPAWIEGANNWKEFYDECYPKCGTLDKWDENYDDWPDLTSEQKQEFDLSCNVS